ncbi:Hypothetical protein ORPV_628 [Orpheovirus IHUMI-LCC2]|uniref:Uncharacterized protein n=1 Tax=Orpheovirus IHUMI-LCC2 TaxID=2023057 RepID=A0A2I2L4R3_9VIRU|nr:Hypothetical protein ORPV_628 [Orpheovirus IHUMI-LCC2]SNW62532.1 Hypothetical protein ORPV_628 [Orpheovirus IHUMI-LCC2]
MQYLEPVQYLKLVSYVLGDNYDDILFRNSLPNDLDTAIHLHFIIDSDNISAIKSMMLKYYNNILKFRSNNMKQFRILMKIKGQVENELNISNKVKLEISQKLLNNDISHNKWYYILLNKDINHAKEELQHLNGQRYIPN